MRDILILRRLKVWCLLLLAAVFAHALIPIEARASGSAFSPSTVEVSTGNPARAVTIRQAAAQRDPFGGVPGMVILAERPVTGAVRAASPCPAATGPPARPAARCTLARPRAPPFA